MLKILSYATSANMGAGFDCLGICLSMANTFIFTEYEDAIIINNHADTIRNKNNLVISSLYAANEIIGAKALPGVKLDIKTIIPLSRGLGSSASCISAGVAAAFMLADITPEKSDIFEIAAKLEGHPDNVAPNIFGGATLSYKKDDLFKCLQFNVDAKFKFIAIIPDFKLSTKKAREVLPETYSREDAVFNMTRVGMMISALQMGNNTLLADALDDRLHQPYRIPLIKGYEQVSSICKDCGAIGTYLSGAGPTVMAIADDEEIYKKISAAIRSAELNWQTELLNVNYEGIECYRMK